MTQMGRALPLAALTLGVAAAVMPICASAADYVITAGNWGKKQDKAVKAAGGVINWSHQQAGIASVSSDNPNFLSLVSGDRAFTSAAEDMMVEWTEQNFTEFNGSPVTPEDEWFYDYQWSLAAIDAEGAWEAGCTGAGARVAIIDGGILDVHPDLEPNLDKDCSASFVPEQPWNYDLGTFWHGTHVAGIVAAADNAMGVIGVAPEATLLGVKALHGGSGSFGWIIGAILYSADPAAFGATECEKADIINMSLGATFNKRLPGAGRLVGAMAQAVNYATSKGTLVLSSAGNDGLDLGQSADITAIPGGSGSGLAIPATGPDDVAGVFGPPGGLRDPAVYSNYGEGTSFVAAPGGQPGTTATVDVNSPDGIAGTKRAALAAWGPVPSGETGEVALWMDASDESGDPHDACEPGIDPGVAGKMALIHRGACTFVTKAANAEASGAIGVLISNNRPGPAAGMAGELEATIPAVGITQDDGADMEANLGAPVNVTLNENQLGVFDQVLSTCAAGYCFAYGTSMASPAAAGVAALIKAQNPRLSVGGLKAKLKQSADDEGPRGNDEFYGHGFVNAASACKR